MRQHDTGSADRPTPRSPPARLPTARGARPDRPASCRRPAARQRLGRFLAQQAADARIVDGQPSRGSWTATIPAGPAPAPDRPAARRTGLTWTPRQPAVGDIPAGARPTACARSCAARTIGCAQGTAASRRPARRLRACSKAGIERGACSRLHRLQIAPRDRRSRRQRGIGGDAAAEIRLGRLACGHEARVDQRPHPAEAALVGVLEPDDRVWRR